MRSASPVNADPSEIVVLNTHQMAWESTEWAGVRRKVLEFVADPRKGRETSLLKFDAGASMPSEVLTDRLDIVVLEGTVSDGRGTYRPHTFIRTHPGERIALSSEKGGMLYAKWRVPIWPKGGERIVIDANTAQWADFPHRGASVLHLYRNTDGIETGRIGNVHPNRRIPTHDHQIGEETFVLEGRLKDETHEYLPGYWFRMPCGVPHTPYTEAQNCKMLIRDGDLVW